MRLFRLAKPRNCAPAPPSASISTAASAESDPKMHPKCTSCKGRCTFTPHTRPPSAAPEPSRAAVGENEQVPAEWCQCCFECVIMQRLEEALYLDELRRGM